MELLMDVWRILQVALGIGLVIFVHEAGHFLAARWCKVRVDIFSLGFGPRLFGWRRGATLYQIAAVPLGGFVKMAGEESQHDGLPPAPDELAAKSISQRFLIYSGGVIMNVIFAMVVFPVILMWGVPFSEPLVGPPLAGGPAWHAGIKGGSRVLSVNGNSVYGFIHIPNEVALGPTDETLIELIEPGASEPRTVSVRPEYSQANGIYTIDVRPSVNLEGRVQVEPDSPAELAGVKSGDRLIQLEGYAPELTVRNQLRLALAAGEPITARFEGEAGPYTARMAPAKRTLEVQLLGVQPPINRVEDLRSTARVKTLGILKGDRIESLNGAQILRGSDFLRALLEAAESGEALSINVRRGARNELLSAPAPSAAEAISLHEDIYLVPDVESTEIAVTPGSAAGKAGVRDGDRVLSIDGTDVPDFTRLSEIVRGRRDSTALLSLTLQRGSRTSASDPATILSIDVLPGSLEAHDYGLDLQVARYIYKADDPLTAILVGTAHSWKFVEEAYLTLKRILFGQVSGENVGGIITIGVVSHTWAAMGWTKLLFFLCMLSMNLAFLNVLPIPVLDGGHLFFLLVERVKGSPVSERVLGYSQMVGLVLILSLMVYVTYNDLKRWVFD